MAERVSAHLARHGVDLAQVEWQTDSGSEFLEDAHQLGPPSNLCGRWVVAITPSRPRRTLGRVMSNRPPPARG